MVKGGRGQLALALPEIPLASNQTVAQNRAQGVGGLELAEGLAGLQQNAVDVFGVADEDALVAQQRERRHIAVLLLETADESERVVGKIGHVPQEG